MKEPEIQLVFLVRSEESWSQSKPCSIQPHHTPATRAGAQLGANCRGVDRAGEVKRGPAAGALQLEPIKSQKGGLDMPIAEGRLR